MTRELQPQGTSLPGPPEKREERGERGVCGVGKSTEIYGRHTTSDRLNIEIGSGEYPLTDNDKCTFRNVHGVQILT